MSDVLNQLKTDIEAQKKELISEYEADEKGYYLVRQEKMAQYFFNCIGLIRLALEKEYQPIIDDPEFTNGIFKFEKIQTNFSYDSFVKLAQPNEQQAWSQLKGPRSMMPILFEDCILDSCVLSNRLASKVFSEFKIKNCKVHRAEFGAHFFQSYNVSSVSVIDTTIQNIKFSGGSYSVPLTFKHCHFHWTLNAESCAFQSPLKFMFCQFNKSDQKQFDSSVIFNNATFETSTEFFNCDFFTSPKFHGAKFHSDTSFHRSKFHDVKSSSAVGDYRTLKQDMNALGAEHDSMMFHALEMESRRNTILPKIWKIVHPKWNETFASWFLKLTTDYGRNFWLPFLWLIASLFVFAVIYWQLDGIGCNASKLGDSDLWMQQYCKKDGLDTFEVDTFKTGLMYAFQRFWGPLGLIFDSGLLSPRTFFVKFLSILQFIFSSVLWFILIVQIRRQFRL